VVDPSEPRPIEQALESGGLELPEIWLTHHHLDHRGGVESLFPTFGPSEVRGSRYDFEHRRIPCQTSSLDDGDGFRFGRTDVRVLTIPGHTLGAIAYILEGQSSGSGSVFSGDTLFLGGCGR